jgi:UDP-2-acetamido-2,6-beta-L-arabino-hexul-4-ose reductase
MKIVVTGAEGLLGWHASVRLHAANCAARFAGQPAPFELVRLDHAAFEDDARLDAALMDASAVLHFAGVNRAPDTVVEAANPQIARRLAGACTRVGVRPHVVYANSTHADSDTPYGRSKRIAGDLLSRIAGGFTDLILPHVFGEGARPRYNNVTATFIEAVIAGETPAVDAKATVFLLHAGSVAQAALDAVLCRQTGTLRPDARPMPVPVLFDRLQRIHRDDQANVFPDLSDAFSLALFNTYRAALYPKGFPRPLKLNSDARGMLFEAVKGGGGGQTFASWTNPGITRGDHFHLQKVERFLVLDGEAVIRIRRVLGGPVWEYRVSGTTPAAVDIPTLHTHSIENIGTKPLLTLFWAHEVFDPAAPDTFFDPVLKGPR